MPGKLPSTLSRWLLGSHPGRRERSILTLLTMAGYVTFALLQEAEVLLGYIDARASNWLTMYYLCGALVFYLLVRTGWSERLSPAEPSMTMMQAVYAILAIVGSYAITGPARGAVLAILVLVLAYGMFSLSGRQARGLAVFALVALIAAMAWKHHTDPLHYPGGIELVHLAFAVIVLAGVSALSVRMGLMRRRLREQKQALAQSLEQIRLLATRDELTGLVNRRHMMELMQAEQSRQQRHDSAMSLVLLDLDHFKRVNDDYGHQAGDTVLRAFADSVRSGLRGSDVMARWGGEEFLLMLPETSPDEALRAVARLRTALTGVSIQDVAPGWQLTFSAGAATCAPGEPIGQVIDRADQALYRAKRAGRNCTVSA
jgi:diguanylate cyclase (GGDEF)-like protein